MKNPEIYISKLDTPVIYLDTCMLIELSRYVKGCCTNKHIVEIGKLYDVLMDLMQSNMILCPLGNQIEEMGLNKKREDVRTFLNRFINSEFYLPDQIYNEQLDAGYHCYEKMTTNLLFRAADVFKYINSPNLKDEIYILVEKSRKMNQGKKEVKKKTAESLNKFKQSEILSKDFETQYARELQADYQVLGYIQEKCRRIPEMLIDYKDFLIPVFKRSGIKAKEFIAEGYSDNHRKYLGFLTSPYQCKLPYIHIRAVLYTHILQRANKIKPSDKLDILWACSYLPFVDFAVTDERFCRLLNDSGLSAAYHTKVYDFSTIKALIEDVSK